MLMIDLMYKTYFLMLHIITGLQNTAIYYTVLYEP